MTELGRHTIGFWIDITIVGFNVYRINKDDFRSIYPSLTTVFSYISPRVHLGEKSYVFYTFVFDLTRVIIGPGTPLSMSSEWDLRVVCVTVKDVIEITYSTYGRDGLRYATRYFICLFWWV